VEGNGRSNAMPSAGWLRRLSLAEEFELIQMRAYYLWQQAGSPPGDAARGHFWFQAEHEIGPL